MRFVDNSDPHLVREIVRVCQNLSDEVGRPIHVISEVDWDCVRSVKELGCSAAWYMDFRRALWALLFRGIKGAPRLSHTLGTPESLTRTLMGGVAARELIPENLVCALETHDDAGNSPRGIRFTRLLASVAGANFVEAYKSALTLLKLFGPLPMVFAGQESGASTPFPFFHSHADPMLARQIEQGRDNFLRYRGYSEKAKPLGNARTRDSSVLRMNKRKRATHLEILDFDRRLNARRLELAPILGKRWGKAIHFGNNLFTVKRPDLEVVVNFSPETVRGVPAWGRLINGRAEP
jgi:maltooligosyltrehalose trehalohydrolase